MIAASSTSSSGMPSAWALRTAWAIVSVLPASRPCSPLRARRRSVGPAAVADEREPAGGTRERVADLLVRHVLPSTISWIVTRGSASAAAASSGAIAL